MVLSTTSQQYAFLQVLTQAYLSMLNAFQTTTCVVYPQIFQNCTDISSYGSNPPSLPTIANTAPIKSNGVNWQYSDYNSYSFYGFTSTSFKALTPNITDATTNMLLAACASDDTCTSAYTAFNNTNDALAVINALITTNINTIQATLNARPKNSWNPSTNYAYFSQMYTQVPGPSDEIYGFHDAVTWGIVNGVVNGSVYETVTQLSYLLYGGASMYESLIHTVAMGSFAYDSNQQSNINLTAPQVFHHINDGTLDTRSAAAEAEKRQDVVYETKWDIWLAESQGRRISNKAELIEGIKQRARNASMTQFNSLDRQVGAASKCTPPTSTQSGIAWLNAVTKGCTAYSYAAASLNLQKGLSEAVMEGTKDALGAFGHTAVGVAGGQLINLCGASSSGNPCYTSQTAWLRASEIVDAVALFTAIGVAAEAAPLVGALEIAGASISIGCDIANEVSQAYQNGLLCCQTSCTSSACQQSIGGCAQTAGIC